VPREKLAHIFEKFSQAESSTVRQYGGTGLGLTITKLLLELMRSEIKVESRVGEGSRFYFSLPVREASLDEQVRNFPVIAEEKELEPVGLKLLLVEDVEINRKILLQFFKNWWQIQPDEALNGKQAVEKAAENEYDIILMDIRMPVMDGYEATKRIRKIEGYKNVPILALTADKNLEEKHLDDSSQFNDLLTKPFDPNQLKQRILYHLKRTSSKGLEKTPSINGNSKPPSTPQPESIVSKPETKQNISFNISRFNSLAGSNKEVLDKLLNNSIKAIKTYNTEFIAAAETKDAEAVSGLIHKNTINLHYIQAGLLGEMINEYREMLRNNTKESIQDKQEAAILEEFDKVIEGLESSNKLWD